MGGQQMTRAFDGFLDMLNASANQLSLINTATFTKNVHSYLQNALNQIQPSDEVFFGYERGKGVCAAPCKQNKCIFQHEYRC